MIIPTVSIDDFKPLPDDWYIVRPLWGGPRDPCMLELVTCKAAYRLMLDADMSTGEYVVRADKALVSHEPTITTRGSTPSAAMQTLYTALKLLED